MKAIVRLCRSTGCPGPGCLQTAFVMLESILSFRRLEELESLLERVDHNSRSQLEELTAQLHGKSSEVSGLQLENERLKVSSLRQRKSTVGK